MESKVDVALVSAAAAAAGTLPSVFTPLVGMPPAPRGFICCPLPKFEPGEDEELQACGEFALGRPLEQLKAEQRRAVRAVNFQQADGRWLSPGAPPRGSAHVELLSRSCGELHMRLPWPTTRCGGALSVLGAALWAAVAIVVPMVVAAAGAPVRLVAALDPVLGIGGAILAARALIAERQCHREVCVSAQTGRFSVLCVPWWLPAAWACRALALPGWKQSSRAAVGTIEDLLGAEVRRLIECMMCMHTVQCPLATC